jgi:hypothetical protein
MPPNPELMNRTTISAVPNSLQIRCEYTGTNCIYAGYAERGVATSAARWFIMKMTYDVSDNLTLKQTTEGVAWDDRATSSYA